MTTAEQELHEAQVEVEHLTDELAATRTLDIAVGIVAERLKISDDEAEQSLRALAARDDRQLGDLAAELARTKHLH